MSAGAFPVCIKPCRAVLSTRGLCGDCSRRAKLAFTRDMRKALSCRGRRLDDPLTRQRHRKSIYSSVSCKTLSACGLPPVPPAAAAVRRVAAPYKDIEKQKSLCKGANPCCNPSVSALPSRFFCRGAIIAPENPALPLSPSCTQAKSLPQADRGRLCIAKLSKNYSSFIIVSRST